MGNARGISVYFLSANTFHFDQSLSEFHCHWTAKMVLAYFGQLFRDIRNPDDVYSSQRPLLIMCFFYGLLPFHLIGYGENRHLELTPIGVISTGVHAVLFFISYFKLLTTDKTFIAHFFTTKISQLTSDIQITTSSLSIGFSLFFCFIKRDKFRCVLEALSKIDKRLKRMGAHIEYKKISALIVICLLVKFFLYAFLLLGSYLLLQATDAPNIHVWYLFFSPHIISASIKVLFMFIVHQIRYRFRSITHILNKIRQNQTKVNGEIPSRGSLDDIKIISVGGISYNSSFRTHFDVSEVIKELCQTHEELCDASYLAEEYFSHQMLALVATEFFTLVCCLYYIANVLYNDSGFLAVSKTEFILFFGYYSLLSFMSIGGTVRAACWLTNEVKFNQSNRQPDNLF